MTFQTLASSAQKLIADNSPLILTGIGAAGVITTAVLTGKATIKAVEISNTYRYDEDPKADLFITPKELVFHVWKLYIPPALSGAAAVAAIIAAHQIGNRRAAAMASAYILSNKALDEYRDKVAEKFGESRAQAVRDDINQDRVSNTPVGEIISTGKGTQLCLEPMSMRYFYSSREDLMWAQNSLNHSVLRHQYASLTDFYDLIGLDRTLESDELGWNSDELLELTFTSALSDKGMPCLVMNYQVKPGRDYHLVH